MCIPDGPLVAMGDSLTAGGYPASGLSYPQQLALLIGRPISNQAVGGTVSGPYVGFPSVPSIPDVTGPPATILLSIGYNDLSSAIQATTEEVISRRLAYAAVQEANGHTVIQLAIPQGNSPPTGNTRRKEINDYFAANYFRYDSKVGDLANLDDTLYYVDRIHQTELGNGVKAQRVYDFLRECQPSPAIHALAAGISDFLVLNYYAETSATVEASFGEFLAYARTDDEMPDISLSRLSAGIRDYLVFNELPTVTGDAAATIDAFTADASVPIPITGDVDATLDDFTVSASDGLGAPTSDGTATRSGLGLHMRMGL